MMMTTKELESKLFEIDLRLFLLKTDDGEPSSIYWGDSIRSDTLLYDFGIKGYGVQGFIKENCLKHIPDKIHDLNKLLDEYYKGRKEILARDSEESVDSTDPEKSVIEPAEITDNHNPFKKYTDKLAETLLEKNRAYANSYDATIEDFGLIGMGFRVSDKANRIKRLVKAGKLKENDESLMDTMLDTAGYAILGYRYLDEHKEELERAQCPIKVKYFNEGDYQDASDNYARMQDAVNSFCAKHEVIRVDATQNADEDFVTVVTYKE